MQWTGLAKYKPSDVKNSADGPIIAEEYCKFNICDFVVSNDKYHTYDQRESAILLKDCYSN